jgi:tetratricopeptide (TPR) repeat protein
MSTSKAREFQTSTKVDKKLWWSLIGCVTLAVVICYINTLFQGTVFHDELSILLINSDNMRNHTGLSDVIVRPLTQPWVRQSFLQDETSYGTTFSWYHLVNVYFHWLSAVALFALTFRLSWRWRNDCNERHEGAINVDPYKIAVACALIFACHPLCAQSATYLSARYSSMGACNYLLSLNFFLVGLFGRDALRVWGYILCAATGWMCLASSEIGLTLPIALLALFFLAGRKQVKWKEWALNHPYVCGLLIAIAVCAPFAPFFGFQLAALPNWYGMGKASQIQYYATQAKAFLSYYLRCFLAPIGLSVDPPYAQATSFGDPLSLMGAAALAGLVAALVRFRQRRLLALGLGLTLLGLLPHFVIPQAELVADPVLYLSFAGLSITVVALTEHIFAGTWKSFLEKFAPVIVVLAGLAIVHNLDFRDNRILAEKTFKVNSQSAIGYTLLAMTDLGEKKNIQAITDVDKALDINKADAIAWLSKGVALNRVGDYSDADQALQEAVSQSDIQHLALRQTARLELAQNDLQLNKIDDADMLVKSALPENPYNPQAIFLIGKVFYARHSYKEAAMYLHRAYTLHVLAALQPLADCALHLQEFGRAIPVAQQAVSFDNSRRSKLILANAFFGAKQMPFAQGLVSEMLKQSPNSADALALQSLIDEQSSKPDAAKVHREAALKLDPKVFDQLVVPKKVAPKVIDKLAVPKK